MPGGRQGLRTTIERNRWALAPLPARVILSSFVRSSSAVKTYGKRTEDGRIRLLEVNINYSWECE
jgi:hypothetical protein